MEEDTVAGLKGDTSPAEGEAASTTRGHRRGPEAPPSRRTAMIGLIRRSGDYCRLDPDTIERVEATPETVVFLTDGARYCVVETVDEIIQMIRDDRAGVIAACYVLDRGEDPDPMGLGRSAVAPEAHAPGPVIPIRLP
jgi:flagellar protein FlbD